MGAIKQQELSKQYWDMRKLELKHSVDVSDYSNSIKERLYECVDKVIQKEVPIKPLYLKNEIECRNCKSIIAYRRKILGSDIYYLRYCVKCGQKIDWEEGEKLK